MTKISIAKDFSKYPGGRFPSDSKNSGERFRKDLIMPKLSDAIKNGEKLYINIDGVRSFGSSFVEEAFGGIYRDDPSIKPSTIKSHIVIMNTDPLYDSYASMIKKYLKIK